MSATPATRPDRHIGCAPATLPLRTAKAGGARCGRERRS